MWCGLTIGRESSIVIVGSSVLFQFGVINVIFLLFKSPEVPVVTE
jgi:hypothetical protein